MNRLIKWLLAGSALLMLLLVVIVIVLIASGPSVKSNSILLVTLDGPVVETSEETTPS